MWQSADPILAKYLPKTPTKPEEIVRVVPPTVQNPRGGFDLPGMGGVFNSTNVALYTYARQNPLIYVDPDGRAAIFKFVDGSQKVAQNVAEFKKIAQDAGNGTIKSIKAQGHGADDGSFMNLNPMDARSKDGLYLNGDRVQLKDAQGNPQGDLGDVLSGKLSKNAEIKLEGCNTAWGDKNITKATSVSLPDATVEGSILDGVFMAKMDKETLGKNVEQKWLVLPGSTRTYKNGEKQ